MIVLDSSWRWGLHLLHVLPMNHWMYSCYVSFVAWYLEWIQVAAYPFVAAELYTWHSLFFTASIVCMGAISSISLYTIHSFVQANYISGHWVNLAIFSTWLIHSKNDLSPLPPSYVCESAKKWSFMSWACKSENLEMRGFVSHCIACWLNSSITNASVLVDKIIQLGVLHFVNELCKVFDFLGINFAQLVAHIHLLDFVSSMFVGNVEF